MGANSPGELFDESLTKDVDGSLDDSPVAEGVPSLDVSASEVGSAVLVPDDAGVETGCSAEPTGPSIVLAAPCEQAGMTNANIQIIKRILEDSVH